MKRKRSGYSEATMSDGGEDLESMLAVRKKVLLYELGLVSNAIAGAKSRSDADTVWIAKLEKWHGEIYALIEDPRKEGDESKPRATGAQRRKDQITDTGLER